MQPHAAARVDTVKTGRPPRELPWLSIRDRQLDMNEGKRRPDRVSLQTLVARGSVVRPNAQPRHAAPEPAPQERPITVPTAFQPAAAATQVQRRPRPAV